MYFVEIFREVQEYFKNISIITIFFLYLLNLDGKKVGWLVACGMTHNPRPEVAPEPRDDAEAALGDGGGGGPGLLVRRRPHLPVLRRRDPTLRRTPS